jgi:integrase
MRGQGRIYERGGVFWIEYWYRGRQYRESSGSADPKKAEGLLKQRRDEIGADRLALKPFVGPRQERVTVEDLLKGLEHDYEIQARRSLPQLRAHLKHVRAFFRDGRALAVTADRLRDYVKARQDAGAASATINRELEGLQRAFALAVEVGTLMLAPRFPALAERNARQGFFECPEFEAVLAHLIDSDLRDFLEWCFWTGMRPGEIRALDWPTLDRETWTLRLHAKDAKTGYGRMIPLTGPLRAIIERRLRARRLDCPLIFHRAGRRVGEFRKAWRTACKKAGVSGKLPYDLRRTAVRNMVRAGTDPAVAMKISGHRTRAVFDRYNIIDERDLRAAITKTTAYVHRVSTQARVLPLHRRSAR